MQLKIVNFLMMILVYGLLYKALAAAWHAEWAHCLVFAILFAMCNYTWQRIPNA